MDAPSLAQDLTRDMDIHERKDGRVLRIHGGGETVGEVVIGDQTVRLNLRELSEEAELVAEAEGIRLQGRSNVWKGGGIKVTSENVSAVRELLMAEITEARVYATRVRNVRECISLLERAKKDGVFDQRIERDLERLLGERQAA